MGELSNINPLPSPDSSRPRQPSTAGRGSKSKWGNAGKEGSKGKTKNRAKNTNN